MTPRERVMTSLNHSEPDRVPIDFGGHRSSSIAVQAYKRLREYLGLSPSELYIYDTIQQLAIIEDDVLDVIGADVVQLGCDFHKKPEYWREWRLHDGTEVKIPKFVDICELESGDYLIKSPHGKPSGIQKTDCLYFEQLYYPYLESEDETFDNLEEDFKDVMWLHVVCPPSPNTIEEKGRLAGELRSRTDRAIFAAFGGGLLEPGQFTFRMDNFLMELAGNLDRTEAFLDKLLAIHMRNLEQFLEHVGPHIDVIGFGDDLGMQSGPQISPQMFDRVFKPRYAKMWGYVKQKCPHLKINLHSCGSIYALIPSLIEAGLDSFNPVQITCLNMEPERLKREFGAKFSFWGGGCDTRKVLSSGTPADVAENVRRNIGAFAPGGGFIFQQVHNILADVPPENIVAMFKAAKEYGAY